MKPLFQAIRPVAGRNYLPPLTDLSPTPQRPPYVTALIALAAILLAVAAGIGMALVING